MHEFSQLEYLDLWWIGTNFGSVYIIQVTMLFPKNAKIIQFVPLFHDLTLQTMVNDSYFPVW